LQQHSTRDSSRDSSRDLGRDSSRDLDRDLDRDLGRDLGSGQSPSRRGQPPSPRWQRSLTTSLVDRIPAGFEPIFRYLGPRQLMLLVGAVLWLCVPLITTRLVAWEQAIAAVMLVLVGWGILALEERQSQKRASEYLHLLLISISALTTLRYLFYRSAYTLNLEGWVNSLFSILLYIAELYAIATLFLAYFQTLRQSDRTPIPLTQPEQWLTVDIYIPTYNEAVDIVRKTVLGALAIDYPRDKVNVYVLDDGRAEKFRDRRAALGRMCAELGCTLLTRDNNDHAKAGNINTALTKTTGDLVLILDCDHIPARSFLQETVGFFTNPKVALVQTPHWFYNPDPFERNLLTRGRVPVGNELFYKVLQKGNDYWNAAFFCGSAAVVRRQYVVEIGGIATETVTEDCHTSLRLHSLGYDTIYYDQIRVAGLAPEKFSAYVGQQVRWARGMAQILRVENPLFNPTLKLRLSQRICYFSATSHFFFGFPRLMYLLAPMLYLFLGINSVKGLGLETIYYALPHILLSMQANHIPYKKVRFSFWNEIYEFAMSFQAGIVTLLALVNPKLGSFNVTDKGLTVSKRSFDLDSVRYLLILGVMTAASMLLVPFWLILSPAATQAVLINALWCVFNLVLVTAACLVAFEQPERRRAHRLPHRFAAVIHSGDRAWPGTVVNISENGALIELEEWPNIPEEVRVEVTGDYGATVLLEARVVRGMATPQLKTRLSLHFLNISPTQWDDLVLVLYSDVREWYSQERSEADNPVVSLRFIATSIRRVFQEFTPAVGVRVRQQVQAIALLYWEGWSGHSFPAAVTEMGLRSVRLEIADSLFLDPDLLDQARPLIGLLVARNADDPQPQSLLAQVQSVTALSDAADQEGAAIAPRIALELTFPETLDRQQKSKIQRSLRTLQSE
jgi:cellulose synthase (UDP-forming)